MSCCLVCHTEIDNEIDGLKENGYCCIDHAKQSYEYLSFKKFVETLSDKDQLMLAMHLFYTPESFLYLMAEDIFRKFDTTEMNLDIDPEDDELQ